MKLIVFAVGLSMVALHALSATCGPENKGEESCQAGTVKRCVWLDVGYPAKTGKYEYVWKRINVDNGLIEGDFQMPGKDPDSLPTWSRPKKCGDSNHTEAGGKK